MKVIASYNLKGGVGKTAAAVNLAWLAARSGARCLVWDLDPQGAASFYFRTKARIKGGAKRLVQRRHELEEVIQETAYADLQLIPADISTRNLDLLLNEARKSERRIAKALKPLAGDYDYVFLDCPPGLSLVSENVFRAADVLLIPLIPTVLSLRAYKQIQRFCRDQDLQPALLPFFSMVDRRRSLHRALVDNFAGVHPEILAPFIPYASQVEQMGAQRAPLGCYAPLSPPAQAFEALWQTLLEKLGPGAATA